MYWMEIGGRTILYTGDYSMEDDRHLMAAELPGKKPDLLMVEATYGVQVHASRAEREARFTGTIERVITWWAVRFQCFWEAQSCCSFRRILATKSAFAEHTHLVR
jgi:hypothetical protein